MNLTAIETALTAWAETLTGLNVHWRHQPNKALPFPHVEAELLAIRGKGHDEQIETYDTPTDELQITMSGVRALTFTFHFRSRSQSLGASARQYAETFRTRLLRPSSIDTLTAANLALVEVLSLVANDYEDRSGRELSQVSVDLLFEHRSSEADDVWAGDYFDRASGTGTGDMAEASFDTDLII